MVCCRTSTFHFRSSLRYLASLALLAGARSFTIISESPVPPPLLLLTCISSGYSQLKATILVIGSCLLSGGLEALLILTLRVNLSHLSISQKKLMLMKCFIDTIPQGYNMARPDFRRHSCYHASRGLCPSLL